MEEKYLTVSALNKYIKYKFDHDFNLQMVFLKGEISNFKRHSRGHFYFTIKDDKSQISALMFSSDASNVGFEPCDGSKVLVCGRITVYEATGNYQIYVSDMKEDGIGELYVAYEKLKKKLSEEGLFDIEHKKPIPKFPQKIGVITSPTGAAIRDIINTVNRRYPLAKIIIYPSLVQGEDAKYNIVEQIKRANIDNIVDVIILARGGGSIEDLWAFNEEIVARAVYESIIPLISAVGHETDFTIVDFVSDKRAPTPTAGAELSTPDGKTFIKQINEYKTRIETLFLNRLKDKKTSLIHLDGMLEKVKPDALLRRNEEKLKSYIANLNNCFVKKIDNYSHNLELIKQRLLANNPKYLIDDLTKSINNLEKGLNVSFQKILKEDKSLLDVLIAKLSSLSPLSLMEKGYGIAYFNNHVLTSIDEVKKNDQIKLQVKDGKLDCLVLGKEKNHE